MNPLNTKLINFLMVFFSFLRPLWWLIFFSAGDGWVVLPGSFRMTGCCFQEGGGHHLKRQMSVSILCRHLFAPAYTETHYTPSGNPQTTTLKSEVSSGQQRSTGGLSWPHPWGVRRRIVETAPLPRRDCLPWPKTKGASRRTIMRICCFIRAPSPLLATMAKQYFR